MAARRACFFIALGLALGLFPTGDARSDIDVVVPPGTSPEWMRFLPRPTLTEIGRVPQRRKRSASEGSVEIVPTEDKKPNWDARFDTTFGFSGITTVDLPQHFPWSIPGPKTPVERKTVLTGQSEQPIEIPYPPKISPHLHWLVIATLLRAAIHPAYVSRPLTIEHLIEIGEPAYHASQPARGQGSVGDIARPVIAEVGPPSSSQPRASGGQGTYQEMIYRLALSELVASHPHDPIRPFARRLMGLGREAFGPTLHYTKDRHPLVKRNAVSALSRFVLPAASARLRELLTDRDRVVRNRALSALAARGDSQIVPKLLGLLRRKTDRRTDLLLVDALGRIGDKRAFGPIKTWIRSQDRDADALWVAIPALARLATEDAALERWLAKLQARLEANPKAWRYVIGPQFRSPAPDSHTRAQVIAEMCLIARAALGTEAAGEVLINRIDKGAPPAAQQRWKVQYDPRGKVLGGLARPNLFLVCEVLSRLGKRGNSLLRQVIDDTTEVAPVRVEALRRMRISTLKNFLAGIEELADIAVVNDLGLVRAHALQQLEALDEETAMKTARVIVDNYARQAPAVESMVTDWAVIPALRMLGRRGDGALVHPSVLIRCITRAEVEFKAAMAKSGGGVNPRAGIAQVPLRSIPPVLEVAILELGRTGKAAATRSLITRLRDLRAPARPEAALALGGIGGEQAARALVAALEDDDAWLRFNCFRALRQLSTSSDQKLVVDWIFAPKPKRQAAVKAWARWLADKYGSE